MPQFEVESCSRLNNLKDHDVQCFGPELQIVVKIEFIDLHSYTLSPKRKVWYLSLYPAQSTGLCAEEEGASCSSNLEEAPGRDTVQ